jgi:hypothetical protein
MNLFDAAEAQRRKTAGMELSAAAKSGLLAEAQHCAVELARRQSLVTSDDVAAEMSRLGKNYDLLGNAAGSVFRGAFEWTGSVKASVRASTHGRMIKVWRLK